MIGWLEGKTVWSRSSVWLAVDGQPMFIGEGEAFNARERVVEIWPDNFTAEPPKIKEAI